MNWTKLWFKMFGTSTFMGLDMGFWVSLGVVIIIVILMNIIFWTVKPKDAKKIINKGHKKLKNKCLL